MIVFDRATGSGLFRVSSGGGVPTAVTALADGEDAHRWPHFLPDGRHFFYTAVTGACCPPAKPGTIKIGSLDQNEPAVPLLQADSSATYASNRVLFALYQTQTLMAQAFDPDRTSTGRRCRSRDRACQHGGQSLRQRIRLGERDARVRVRRLTESTATDVVRSSRQAPRHPRRGQDGRQSFTLARRTPGRSRPAPRESGESRYLDNRHRPQPPSRRAA